MEAGREFQFLEVIGTNVLANQVVRHFSNLAAKKCWESGKAHNLIQRDKHFIFARTFQTSLVYLIFRIKNENDVFHVQNSSGVLGSLLGEKNIQMLTTGHQRCCKLIWAIIYNFFQPTP